MKTVIEAARVIEQQGFPSVRFVIIGDGDMILKWRSQAQNISNVTFTGWVDRISVLAMLRISDIGIAPYDNELISLPNKPFEYMAAGLPLLSSLRGELEDLIHNEQIGVQYQAGNKDSLVKQIRWLAAHPEERKAMGLRARKLYEEKFSADVIYPQLVRHLESIATNE